MRAVIGMFLAGAVLALSANGVGAEPCAFRADRNVEIDPAGLKALAFELGSSDLRVQGVASLSRIEVHGKACASDDSRLAGLTVEQRRDGARAVVTPHQDNGPNGWSVFGSNYAYIDLEVRVPADLHVEVRSHSGDAVVENVGALDYSAHSGDLLVDHVAGPVAVEVHSGDVRAGDIGSLTVRRAGSGDISAHDVHGEVKVGEVGSGDLVLRDIARGVDVAAIGSGNLSVARAGGDVRVGSIGSGDVTANGVNGDFVVQSAGSGDIHHHGVQGRVQVPKRDEDD